MKGPSLPATAIFSLIIHAAFFFAAVIIIKQTNHFAMPSPYIVSLVGPELAKPSVSSQNRATIANDSAPRPGISSQTDDTAKNLEETKEYISDRIAVMKAIKKAKRLVKLRKSISIKSSNIPKGDTAEASQPAGKTTSGSPEKNYSDKIGNEIRQRWAFPEAWGKNFEAIISVIIRQDGSIRINKIERGSGNLLFDRSVLRAINKASPVSPPPYEMEIELRFTP